MLNRSGLGRAISVDDIDGLPTAITTLAAVGAAIGIGIGIVGLPHLDTMRAFHEVGIMGPLCGATRAVARASVGDLPGAWRFNPLGVVLVVGAWAMIARAMVGRAAGRWVTPILPRRLLAPTVVGVVVLLTVRQQLRAAYLLENVTLP